MEGKTYLQLVESLEHLDPNDPVNELSESFAFVMLPEWDSTRPCLH